MRSLATVALLALVLAAPSAWAQAAAQQPAGQAPAQPRPAAPPVQAPAPAPAPAAPPPVFPAGAKIGIVNLQQIAALSIEGKAATAQINQLVQRRQTEAAQKSKALTDNQTKLQQGGALMTDAARAALERDIDRQTKEAERFQQDAQSEVQELNNELQTKFNAKLLPILQQLATEKSLHMLLSSQDAGIIWADAGVDLTLEAVKRMDLLTPPARPAAAPPAAPAQPPAAPPATPRQ